VRTSSIKFLNSLCVGLGFPIFQTIKSTQTNDLNQHKKWISYWILYFMLYFFENFMSPSPNSYYNEFKILFYLLLIVYAEKLFFIFEKIFENEKQLEDKMEEYCQKVEKKIGSSTFFSSLRIQLKNLLLQSLKENDVPEK
jgi:hypothetical protein